MSTTSQTGTILPADEAKRRIKAIIDANPLIRQRVNGFVAQLTATPNVRELDEIERDSSLTPAQKDEKKQEKKRDLAVFAVYITDQFFRTEVNAKLR